MWGLIAGVEKARSLAQKGPLDESGPSVPLTVPLNGTAL